MRITWEDGTRTCRLDGKNLSPKPSQKLHDHSPDGFNVGYGGSGPAQLALAILLEVTKDKATALKLHQKFKWDVVARWPRQDFEIEFDVLGWLERQGEQAKV